MTDACVQTDDIMINGIPLNEYLQQHNDATTYVPNNWLEMESDASGDDDAEAEATNAAMIEELQRVVRDRSALRRVEYNRRDVGRPGDCP